MSDPIFERVRTSLLQKREGLEEWLHTSPADKKAVLLGPCCAEEAVATHLGTIEDSLEKVGSETLGICEVCQARIETDLLEVDYTACVCLEHLSSEEASRLEDELELAKSVQKALLPQESPDIPGLDVAAFSRPAQFIGGDYFDFISFHADIPGLVIADVAGHGVSASLHMASLQALARAIIPVSHSPSEAVSHIHRLFIHNIHFTTFVTLFAGAYDQHTRTLTYCNAGHNPPLIIHRERDQKISLHWLDPTGAAIGLVEETEFNERTVSLQAGDLLVLYTDGVVEAMNTNSNMFGADRLARMAQELYDLPAREVVRGIREDLEGFIGAGSLSDDTTLVVCKII